ncbi:hypothetical protein HD554DRAFT_1143865 [Boletus coccyginus]|nr:hypothetical protein HD554DRAFT_1143865 [Boletus coccyginus]
MGVKVDQRELDEALPLQQFHSQYDLQLPGPSVISRRLICKSGLSNDHFPLIAFGDTEFSINSRAINCPPGSARRGRARQPPSKLSRQRNMTASVIDQAYLDRKWRIRSARCETSPHFRFVPGLVEIRRNTRESTQSKHTLCQGSRYYTRCGQQVTSTSLWAMTFVTLISLECHHGTYK